MELFENIMINFLEIVEEYKWWIDFLIHYWYSLFFLIIYSKNLLKTDVLY